MLKNGMTTGACAAICAKAAAIRLLLGIEYNEYSVTAPEGRIIKGEPHYIDGKEGLYASYGINKDSGDDPDVTNGCLIICRAELIKGKESIPENCFSYSGREDIYIDGGTGVGRVTMPGLEQSVGQAAINRVPREMIFRAVEEVITELENDPNIKVMLTIEVPEGEALALKTFNSKLGIKGGISILGTTGVLEPMSTKALIDSIDVEIKQKYVLKPEQIILAPGNIGIEYLKSEYGIAANDIVKTSNYIGDALDMSVKHGFKDIVLAGDIGKLCKLAAGIFNTHSKNADGRGEVFALNYLLAGGNTERAAEIRNAINTAVMMDIIQKDGLLKPVIDGIIGDIIKRISLRIGDDIRISVLLFAYGRGLVGKGES